MFGERPTEAELTATEWDLVVIGGGITGAGVALEAAKRLDKVLLVEQRDFAWGTSSRSSKMVHGGLRYLAQGDWKLTRHSLLERERLIRELPDLVVRKTYVFPVHKGQFPGRWAMKLVLWFYDRLAGIRDHRWLPAKILKARIPTLKMAGISGAMTYTDALTDDARLVMRTLHEAAANGAKIVNYQRVTSVTSQENNDDFHLTIQADNSDEQVQLRAARVVNATGAFADRLSAGKPRVRPQRGSHLFFPQTRLPVNDCLTLLHPTDKRPVFVFPWQGVTCVGTTDIDHQDSLDNEARISNDEVDYLLDVVNSQFPKTAIKRDDILSSMAGVRPIVASGQGKDPSKERRDHAIWITDGIVSVSGGKLTTFRLIALDVMKALHLIDANAHQHASKHGDKLFQHALPFALGNPLHAVAEGQQLEAQLRWILANEMVMHLDDLMLRRTRLGNLLAQGGEALLPRIKPLCCQQLHWDDARWEQEVRRYRAIVTQYYQPPTPSVP